MEIRYPVNMGTAFIPAVAEPAASEPAAEPTASEPAAELAASEPAAEPAASEPAAMAAMPKLTRATTVQSFGRDISNKFMLRQLKEFMAEPYTRVLMVGFSQGLTYWLESAVTLVRQPQSLCTWSKEMF